MMMKGCPRSEVKRRPYVHPTQKHTSPIASPWKHREEINFPAGLNDWQKPKHPETMRRLEPVPPLPFLLPFGLTFSLQCLEECGGSSSLPAHLTIRVCKLIVCRGSALCFSFLAAKRTWTFFGQDCKDRGGSGCPFKAWPHHPADRSLPCSHLKLVRHTSLARATHSC